jgi:hypothetical protein
MSNLRNILIPSVLLFTLVGVGCSNKNETAECDQTKFDCTPKASEPVVSTPASEVVVTEKEIESEPEIKTVASEVKNKATWFEPQEGYQVDQQIYDWFKPTINEKMSKLFKEVDPDVVWSLQDYKIVGGKDKAFLADVNMVYHKSKTVKCYVLIDIDYEDDGVYSVIFPNDSAIDCSDVNIKVNHSD